MISPAERQIPNAEREKKMSNPLISIIVCTYNRGGLLQGCLESLAEQTLEASMFEVIVVDNNSTDNTLEIAGLFAKTTPNIRIFTEVILGHSHARNRGWREARGEYVAYIDDDAKASPDWCERILHAFKTVTPTPAAVGGQIHPFYEVPPPSWFTDDFEIRTWGGNAGFLELPRARYGFSGSNMAFQRKILERHGGFSSRYGIVDGTLRMGEDTEFFNRIYDEEPNFWYDPLIKVFHLVPKRNFKVIYRIGRSYNCAQSFACINGEPKKIVDYAKCFADILFSLSRALRAILISGSGFRRESVKFLEKVGCSLGLIIARKQIRD